jgi:hypothetical protein
MKAQDFVIGTLPRLRVPLVLWNATVAAAAVAWVLAKGDFVLAFGAILLLVPGAWLLGHLLGPTGRLATRVEHFAAEEEPFKLALFAGLQTLYGIALVTLWCVSAFGLFLGVFRHTGSDFPALLLSWAFASAPWTWHACRENAEVRTTALGAIAAQIAGLTLLLGIGALGLPTEKAYFLLGGVMLLAFVGATLLVVGVWMEWMQGSEATEP